jgi:predicted nucleic acid-binding protein
VSIFVDSSALVAAVIREDVNYEAATLLFRSLLDEDEPLITTNYIAVETIAVLQTRSGMEAVRAADGLMEALEVQWVSPTLHGLGQAALLRWDRRRLSLVDCVSFFFMREQGLARVFTFDRHFAEQGFAVIP